MVVNPGQHLAFRQFQRFIPESQHIQHIRTVENSYPVFYIGFRSGKQLVNPLLVFFLRRCAAAQFRRIFPRYSSASLSVSFSSALVFASACFIAAAACGLRFSF